MKTAIYILMAFVFLVSAQSAIAADVSTTNRTCLFESRDDKGRPKPTTNFEHYRDVRLFLELQNKSRSKEVDGNLLCCFIWLGIADSTYGHYTTTDYGILGGKTEEITFPGISSVSSIGNLFGSKGPSLSILRSYFNPNPRSTDWIVVIWADSDKDGDWRNADLIYKQQFKAGGFEWKGN